MWKCGDKYQENEPDPQTEQVLRPSGFSDPHSVQAIRKGWKATTPPRSPDRMANLYAIRLSSPYLDPIQPQYFFGTEAMKWIAFDLGLFSAM